MSLAEPCLSMALKLIEFNQTELHGLIELKLKLKLKLN